MAADPPADVLDGLNDAQRDAAVRAHGPLCILAGAGTGKTRTITHRIAQQVATGVARADQVLAVTFTDKAAAQMRRRIAAFGLPAPVRAATFHAAAWAQLRWFWPRLDDGPLPGVLASKVGPLIPFARRTRTQAQDLAAEIEWAKARCLTPDSYARAARDRDAPLEPGRMAEVYARYEQDNADRGLIDYEDMLLRCAALLTEHPDAAAEVHDRYRFFTVDEFQDVNPAQFRLLQAWLGDRDEVCVVGDDDQTIYSFTGATSDYLVGFRRHFPDAPIVRLTENYRSTPQVLALANRVLWTKAARSRKQLVACQGSGPAPTFTEFAAAEDEVAGVVHRIEELLADGLDAGQIAICYRVNSQSEPFEEALRRAGVPCVVRGDAGFFARREIRQALAVLRAAADRPPPPAPLGLEDTVAAAPPRADDLVRQALRSQMGWDPRKEPDGEAARDRWRNLGALVEVAARIVEADREVTLPAVAAELQRRADAGQEAPHDGGAVTLLTLHRAKGLEFDAVFLVALEEGLLPISHAKTDAAVEEERRLLYVGVTRARRHLTLSWARSRTSASGRSVGRRPSRLLYNLGDGAPTAAKNGKKRERAATRPLFDAEQVDAALVERLRDWRRRRAQEDGVPAYVVFPDTTLVEIAARRPGKPDELLMVHGMGRTKVSRYGDDVITVLNA